MKLILQAIKALHRGLEKRLDGFGQRLDGCISTPESAQVGQIIQVAAVDENGRPTEWEAVAAPKIPEIPSVMEVIFTYSSSNGKKTVSESFANIMEAYNSGRTVRMKYDDYILHLTSVDSDFIGFTCAFCKGTSSVIYTVSVKYDGSIFYRTDTF